MKIHGEIKDATTDEPLAGAKVGLYVEETELASLTTEQDGTFDYEPGADYEGMVLTVKVSCEGYKPHETLYQLGQDTVAMEIALVAELTGITIEGSVVSEASGDAIGRAEIVLKSGGEQLARGHSRKDGAFSISVPARYLNQTLNYEVKKGGYKEATGQLQVNSGTETLNVRLTTIHDLHLWYGLRSRRKLLIIGGGLLAAVLVILPPIHEIPAFFVPFIIGPSIMLDMTYRIKGYLIPVLGAVTVLAGMVLHTTLRPDGLDFAGAPLIVIPVLYLIIGLGATLWARKKFATDGPPEEAPDSSIWAVLLNFVKKSLARFLSLIGLVVVALIILAIIWAWARA